MGFNSKQNVKLLSWFYVLQNLRFYVVLSALYFSHVTGSFALGMSVFSIAQISQAVFEIPTGIYSDSIGRRKSLIFGTVLSLLSVLLYAIGTWYVVLVIGAIIEGIFRSLFSGNNDALLYETLSEGGQKSTYHAVLGKIHSNLEMSGFFAVIIGGFLASQSYELMMWLSVIPQILSLFIALKIAEPKVIREKVGNIYAHIGDAVMAYKKNSKLRNISLASIIGVGVGDAAWSFQSVFYRSVLPVWAVGSVLSLNFLISTISFRLSGKIIDTFKALNVLIYQEVYSRFLYFLALLFPTVASPFVMAAASVLYGPGEVAKNTLLQEEFTDKQRATMASLNSLAGNCLFAVLAFFIGLIADKVGPAISLLITQVCLLPVLFFYIQAFRGGNHNSENQ